MQLSVFGRNGMLLICKESLGRRCNYEISLIYFFDPTRPNVLVNGAVERNYSDYRQTFIQMVIMARDKDQSVLWDVSFSHQDYVFQRPHRCYVKFSWLFSLFLIPDPLQNCLTIMDTSLKISNAFDEAKASLIHSKLFFFSLPQNS